MSKREKQLMLTYESNGERYRFGKLRKVDGMLRGYCYKLKKWAELGVNYIEFSGGEFMYAHRIDSDGRMIISDLELKEVKHGRK